MRIDCYHHGDDELLSSILQMARTLALIHTQLDHQGARTMSALTDLKALLDDVKSSIENVATDVDTLLKAVPIEGGMSPEDVAAFRAELAGVADRAKSVADKYPTAPVEEPPAV